MAETKQQQEERQKREAAEKEKRRQEEERAEQRRDDEKREDRVKDEKNRATAPRDHKKPEAEENKRQFSTPKLLHQMEEEEPPEPADYAQKRENVDPVRDLTPHEQDIIAKQRGEDPPFDYPRVRGRKETPRDAEQSAITTDEKAGQARAPHHPEPEYPPYDKPMEVREGDQAVKQPHTHVNAPSPKEAEKPA